MKNTPGHGEKLSYYDWGETPFYALQSDQRFSYCMYVPQTYSEKSSNTYPLIVLVHGTCRAPFEYRSHFAEFCDEHHCIALAPLFPVGMGEDGDLDGYKYIAHKGIRYDHVLNAMIDEVARKYRIEEKVLLHGFSGGGHFVHRYFFLHPGRLRVVSIGAPGVVTLLNSELAFWRGTKDLNQVFGVKPDIEAMQKVAVQLIVGEQDTETWEITIPQTSFRWMPGANDAGKTRIERIESLGRSLTQNGISYRLDKVPGTAHNGWQLLNGVKEFFSSSLVQAGARGSHASHMSKSIL